MKKFTLIFSLALLLVLSGCCDKKCDKKCNQDCGSKCEQSCDSGKECAKTCEIKCEQACEQACGCGADCDQTCACGTECTQGSNCAKNSAKACNMAYKMILTRTSIRAYSDKAVDSATIEKLLRAAMAAPTAMNKQPWEFVVVTDKVILAELAEKFPNAKMVAGAALAVVACGDINKGAGGAAAPMWVSDLSAASQNLLLAAHSMGLGAVWTGVYPNNEKVALLQATLGLPENIIPLNIIPIGYPKEAIPAAKDKWDTAKIHYNKW